MHRPCRREGIGHCTGLVRADERGESTKAEVVVGLQTLPHAAQQYRALASLPVLAEGEDASSDLSDEVWLVDLESGVINIAAGWAARYTLISLAAS